MESFTDQQVIDEMLRRFAVTQWFSKDYADSINQGRDGREFDDDDWDEIKDLYHNQQSKDDTPSKGFALCVNEWVAEMEGSVKEESDKEESDEESDEEETPWCYENGINSAPFPCGCGQQCVLPEKYADPMTPIPPPFPRAPPPPPPTEEQCAFCGTTDPSKQIGKACVSGAWCWCCEECDEGWEEEEDESEMTGIYVCGEK